MYFDDDIIYMMLDKLILVDCDLNDYIDNKIKHKSKGKKNMIQKL
jgi:hypothetical protein